MGPRGSKMAHPVVHFEVSAKDAGAQREFYTSVFEWEVTVHEEAQYSMFDTGGGDDGIDGGLYQSEQGQSYVTFYIQVDDVAAHLAKAAAAGATPVTQPMEVPGGGTIAMFTDPEGNVVGLYKPA